VRRLAATSAVVLAALGAAGCGSGSSSSLLRDTEAAGLKETLDEIRDAVEARNVGACAARVRELRRQVVNLKPPVDRGLRQRLREEVDDKLIPQVADECDDPKTETLQTTTTPAPTGPTEPAPAPEPEPEPAPEPTPAEPPADTTSTVPPPATEEPAPTAPNAPIQPDAQQPLPDTGGFGEGGDAG
jgi:hypothetical protein